MSKTKLAFLPLVIALLLSGCGQNNNSQTSSDKSDSSSASSEVVKEYTVQFVVEGVVVQTSSVKEGSLAEYQGETPTKAADGDVYKYRFKSWDKDINAPIVEDTVFTALFSAYSAVLPVDDFEDTEDSPTLIDNGWVALGYNNTTQKWTDETAAAISLGSCAYEGSKSLRFDAWENNVGYKIAKLFNKGQFPRSANALKFALKVPSLNVVKVLLHGEVVIAGKLQSPSFTYTINPTSSEYVEYVIPLDADGWALWGEQGKSIKYVADWTGVHQDDLLNYLTRIEFYIQGNLNGWPYVAFLDSVSFVTLDNPQLVEEEVMGSYSVYTGLIEDDHILRVDINADKSAVAKVIDLETPDEIHGHVAVNEKEITFTSDDNGARLVYKGKLVNGGQQIQFVSATGSYKDNIGELKLNAVQVLDDFESYETDGTAYYQGNTDKSQRSGARGAYYSEFYSGSGSTEWGGNGWSLLGGDGSQLKLIQNPSGAHSGNNYLSLKNSASVALRYMQWGLLDGSSEQNSYRGSKLGFWAKTEGFVPEFKVCAYSQTTPRNATKDNYMKYKVVNLTGALSSWTHYEITLEPTVAYYGFLVFMEKNKIDDSYLLIDDVKIYDADPDAQFIPPEPEEPLSLIPNATYVANIGGLVTTKIAVSGNNVNLSVPGYNINKSGTFTTSEEEVTMNFDDGEIIYKATMNEDATSLTFKSVDGTNALKSYLNNLNFEVSNICETAEGYSESGKMYYQNNKDESNLSGARGAYFCDYKTGSDSTSSPVGGKGWSLMGGNGDQLSLDKTIGYTGSQSISIKSSTAGDMRYIQWDVFKGNARPMTNMDTFEIYLKNPNNFAVNVKLMAFKVQALNPNNVAEDNRTDLDLTLSAEQDWTRYVVNLSTEATYYGFGILLPKNTVNSGFINFDDAVFYNSGNNPSINFQAKKDMTLTGTIELGEASVRFGDAGLVYFTCANAGAENMEGHYTTMMVDGHQEMMLNVANTKITGIYSVNEAGVVTFKVTAKVGDLADYIAVDTVFTNN